MKKRILSVLLVLALLMTLVPAATASQSGFATGKPAASYEGGPVKLPVDTLEEKAASGFAQGTAQESKLVNDASNRFSLLDVAKEPQADDMVTFIVTVKEKPLLAMGFTADDIANGTATVTNYEARQRETLETLKSRLTYRFGAEEGFEIGFTYTIATTGVSVTTRYGNLQALQNTPGVEKVYVAPTFSLPVELGNDVGTAQPMTSNSQTMIGADVLNATGYTGKGMKIAILDTGLVLDHPSFRPLPEDKLTESSLTREGVEEIWDTLNASQTTFMNLSYQSTKVPFAFNYVNMDFDVSHVLAGSDHGTHVAGIAAANKTEDTTAIGAAPDAQVVVMQVFTKTGANWGTIMAAMEDALRLDVDTVNLSLGAAAGFSTSADDMSAVLDLFKEADIEVLIASGNDTNNAYMNLTGLHMAYSGNPDIGLAGTPSTYTGALAVASMDNNGGEYLYFTVNGRQIGYTDTAASGATKFLSNFLGKTLEFVAVPGLGEAEAYEGLDVTGKVALVSRGTISFPEKQANAQAAGAIACVVYNNAPGMMNMQINDGEGNIPCVAISQADGQFLVELATGSLTVCEGDLILVQQPNVVSSFSSWGVTPDLKLKPEIAGVGGNIYSSVDPSISGSNYGYMSGTSMATPQVAGAMAVLLQHLKENYDFTGAELRQIAANLAMSTANPAFNGDVEFSPRAQGAGLIDLVKATTSKAYLSNPTVSEGRPKAELGDDDERTGIYEFPFQVTNLSDTDTLTYSFNFSVLTETLYAGQYIANTATRLAPKVMVYATKETEVMKYDFNDDGEITTADARVLLRHINGAEKLSADNLHLDYVDVNGDGITDKADVDMITAYCAELEVEADMLAMATVATEREIDAINVEPGEAVELLARIELSDADKAYMNESFPNGIYVEGFLYAYEETGDTYLSMPFVGFYGDWSDAPVFDDVENPSLYAPSVFTYYTQLGYNPYLRNGASGDKYNAFSYSNPLAEFDIGLLRNARKMLFTVTDNDTGEVYFRLDGEYLGKTHFNPNYGMIVPLFLLADYEEVWNGMDAEGNALPDGTSVTYKTEAWLDDGDDELDGTYSFQVTLDNQMPEIVNAYTLQEDVKIENGRVLLPLTMVDNRYIAAVIFVSPEGIIMGKYAVDNVPGEEYTATYDITGFGTEFTIIVGDYAVNEAEVEVVLDLGEYDGSAVMETLDTGRIYGCETFDSAAIDGGWFSANKEDLSDVRNETYDSTNRYFSAEYINGYLFAQNSATGSLCLITPSSTYWGAQELVTQNGGLGDQGVWVLYDMALDYSSTGSDLLDRYDDTNGDDTLFAVGWMYAGDQDNNGKDDGHNALFRIWISKYNGQIFVDEVAPITGTQDGAEILTLGCTTEGQLYGIDTNAKLYKLNVAFDENTYQNTCTAEYIGTTDFVNVENYSGANVIQSMGYDHNTGKMYWFAHSQTPVGNKYLNVCMTYTVDLETGKCTEVGTYGPGGQTSLFIPHEIESDLFTMGVKPTGFNLKDYELTMAQGKTQRLRVSWEPWNCEPTKITWTSSDEAVATVNPTGLVTALGEGETVITATAEVWNEYRYDENWNFIGAGWETKEATCTVTVVGSNDSIYGFVAEDWANTNNRFSWITYSDKTPGKLENLGQQEITTGEATGEPVTAPALWQGGAYYNGYVYTVVVDAVNDGTGAVGGASVLYRSQVTQGETPAETVFGEPERIGAAVGVELGNLGFDYNTGRMYAVDYTHGGLGIIDLDTGAFDLIGTYTGDIGGPAITPAMCVTADGTIIVSSMFGRLYTVDPDTLYTTEIGNINTDTWFYAAMAYDYNTGNIYWNPCMNAGQSPLYLVCLEQDLWSGRMMSTIVKLGNVSTKQGVEQTVIFTIPENEPETKQIPVEGIEITNGESIFGLEGGTLQLKAVTTPARPTVQAKTWTTSNPDVVTVDRLGKLTYTGVGTATVTVSISNKNPEDGGPFTDSIQVTVYEAAGNLEAFLAYDENGTSYYDFWISVKDYDLGHATVNESMISIYSLRTGAYYDGYYYAYNDLGEFYRISADNHSDYVTLGKVNLDTSVYQITGMAIDYTTGIMYGVTLPRPYQGEFGKLVTINMDNGSVTEIAALDSYVFALACDANGTLYAAGTVSQYGENNVYGQYEDAVLYTVNKETAACTKVTAIPDARVYTGANYYGIMQYNAQMTYDFTTNRLYLNATSDDQGWSEATGMYMIQLAEDGSAPAVSKLGGIGLYVREGSAVKQGDVYLGLLAAIPEAEEIPVGKVNGIVMDKSSGRVAVGATMQLTPAARPSNAENKALTFASADETVATVDENGLVTGVKAGATTITITSVENPEVQLAFALTVVDVSGPQSVAYTISAQKDALVSFNPELPGATAQVVTTLSGGSKVTGMDYGAGCLYYTVQLGAFSELFRYDFVTRQSTSMGELNTWSEISDIAYDEVNNLLYAVGGFYIFQFDVTKLTPGQLNMYTNYVMDSDYCTLQGVEAIDGAVYYIGNDYYTSRTKLVKMADKYLSDREVLVDGLNVNTVAGKTEMSYDTYRSLFYVTDAADRLYSFDMAGNVTPVDTLGDGIDLNGLAIVPPANND